MEPEEITRPQLRKVCAEYLGTISVQAVQSIAAATTADKKEIQLIYRGIEVLCIEITAGLDPRARFNSCLQRDKN